VVRNRFNFNHTLLAAQLTRFKHTGTWLQSPNFSYLNSTAPSPQKAVVAVCAPIDISLAWGKHPHKRCLSISQRFYNADNKRRLRMAARTCII